MLFCVILGIIAEVIDTVLGTEPIVNSLLNLALLIPSLAVGARRLHDIGRSGWWQLLMLTVIGVLVLIWWWATETRPQNNEYISCQITKPYKSRLDAIDVYRLFSG